MSLTSTSQTILYKMKLRQEFYFGGLLKIDSKSILADSILAVGHRCWIILMYDIPHRLHSFMWLLHGGVCNYGIYPAWLHLYFIDRYTTSFSSLTSLFDRVGTTDGKQWLPSCNLIHTTFTPHCMMHYSRG